MVVFRSKFVIGALLASILVGGNADLQAQPKEADPRFNPATGIIARNFPPSRRVDYTHMTLALQIDDMNVPLMQCQQTLKFEVIERSLESLTLDAMLLDVQSVVSDGHSLKFETDGERLVITFDEPLTRGDEVEIVTTYTVARPPEGIFWAPARDEAPRQTPQLHTQGEARSSSYWFPCRDSPNDRFTTEVIATVPTGFLASSNGFLVSRELSQDRSVETFHWFQDKPHSAYLVTLVVGKFDVVDVGTESLPMPVYVPQSMGGEVQGTYGNTKEMIAYFEDVLDEPYPWDRYAQLVVRNFNFGGMENTSATTMYETAILSEEALRDHDIDSLIAHELAHQWFGDLVTCNSWEHIWLNEGFATYLSALWFGKRDGDDGYEAVIRGNFDSLIERDRGAAPIEQGMVSNIYNEPLDPFFKAANPYSKGSSLLHMLRRRVGDEVFFAIMAQYVDRFNLDTVETSDFRKLAEEVSGESLIRFFEQWCDRPGLPRMKVEFIWDETTSELVVSMEQTQTIDGHNPAYVFSAPIWVEQENGQTGWAQVEVDARNTTSRIPLESAPDLIAIDPEMTVLAEWMVDQTVKRWIHQLRRGPTLSAKVQAIRALESDRSREASSLLIGAIEDDRMHDLIRTESLAALAKRGEEGRLMALGGVAIESPTVRRSLVESIVALENPSESFRDFVSFKLDQSARTDPAQTVRAAAVRGLGRAGLTRRKGVVIAALRTESQHDAIRQAAIESAADLNAEIATVLPYVDDRYLRSTRQTAISAIVKLAKQDPDAALDALEPLLGETERGVQRAAGRAIVDLANPRGLDVLSAFIDLTQDETDRSVAREWLEQLETKLAEGQ